VTFVPTADPFWAPRLVRKPLHRCRLAPMHRLLVAPALLLLASVSIPVAQRRSSRAVLVFSRPPYSATAPSQRYRRHHGSSAGEWISRSTRPGAGRLYPENLAALQPVVFLSTTGDVLNPAQQDVFERLHPGGGRYVGVHSATAPSTTGRVRETAGAYFNGHPG